MDTLKRSNLGFFNNNKTFYTCFLERVSLMKLRLKVRGKEYKNRGKDKLTYLAQSYNASNILKQLTC